MMVVVRDALIGAMTLLHHARCVTSIRLAAVIVVMRNVPGRVRMIMRLGIGRFDARGCSQGDCLARHSLCRGKAPVGDKLQHQEKDNRPSVHEPVTNL
jgi:hypothetical protein